MDLDGPAIGGIIVPPSETDRADELASGTIERGFGGDIDRLRRFVAMTESMSTGATSTSGQQLEPEHPGRGVRQGQALGGDSFDQEDFLRQGSGAGEASGMGRTSSTSSSPGGGR